MAWQALSACKQKTYEFSAMFANRLLILVRAAIGHPAIRKERVFEEVVARLRPDIRYYVKLDNPSSFEQAVSEAQMAKQLIAETTADRFTTPSVPPKTTDLRQQLPEGSTPGAINALERLALGNVDIKVQSLFGTI